MNFKAVARRFRPVPSLQTLLAATALATTIAPAAYAQSSTPSASLPERSFNIASQPLRNALRQLMQQGAIQIGFEASDVDGKTSAGVSGDMSVSEALSRLLGGTGLPFRYITKGSVVIERSPLADGETIQLGPVRVEGKSDSFAALAGPGAVIGNLPPTYAGGQVANGGQLGMLGNRSVMDTPFNQTSYTALKAQDQQAKTIKDVLMDDPSIRLTSLDGGPGVEGGTIRGFPTNSSEISYGGLYGVLPTFSPMAEVAERVEVLKGPSILMNGMPPGGTIGGTINIAPKRAPEDGIRQVTASFISTGQLGGHIDIGQRFGEEKQFGVRFNGVFRDGEGAVGNNSDRRGLALLGADFRSDRVRLSLDVGYQYQKIDGVISYIALDDGVALPDAPDGRINQGQPWSYNEYKDVFGAARAEFDLADNVTVYGAFGAHDSRFGSLYSSIITALDQDGTAIANSAMDIEQYRTMYTGEVGLRAQLKTGSIDHQIAISGTLYSEEFGMGFVFAGTPFASDIYDPTMIARPPIARPATPKGSTSGRSSIGIADTLSFMSGKMQLTLGGRLQKVESKSYQASTGLVVSRYDKSAFSPAVAVLVKPSDRVSVYANYIQGLQPGSIVGTSFANAGEVLPPYKSKQYEAGVKFDFGRAMLTASIFQLAQPSLLTDVSTNRLELIGEQRNRGLELNISGEPVAGLRLLGGVMLLDGKLTKTQDGANDGLRAPSAPKVNLNLSAEWDVPFLKGLTLDGRVTHTSSQFIDTALPRRELPDWTRVDVGVRYSFGSPFASGGVLTLRVNVDNLLDNHYWAGGDSGTLVVGAPRSLRTSLTADF